MSAPEWWWLHRGMQHVSSGQITWFGLGLGEGEGEGEDEGEG